jgi:hypothetical protein
MRTAPQFAWRDCTLCQAYVYDDETGNRVEQPRGSGQWLERPAGALPRCRLPGVGCPKGTPESPRTLSAANLQAWQFHCECLAVQQFPPDPLVRRNARIITAALCHPP